jgi:hypothetical protein
MRTELVQVTAFCSEHGNATSLIPLKKYGISLLVQRPLASQRGVFLVWLPRSVGYIRKLRMFFPCAQIPMAAICYCLRWTQSKINRNGVVGQDSRNEREENLRAQGFHGKHEKIRTRYN